jgi:predicted MFS family arabinose efflux permease
MDEDQRSLEAVALNADAPAQPPGIPLRLPVAAGALAVGLVYLAMFAVPPLITLFVDELGLSHSEAGALMSVSLGGYLITSIFSGRLVDHFGPGRIVVAGLVLCGAASICFTLSDNFALLLTFRTVIGVAAGLVFAPSLAFVASLLGSRANLGVGVVLSGLATGTTVAYFATRHLAEARDWRLPFWIFGVAAFVGASVFGTATRRASASERSGANGARASIRDLLANAPFRLLLVAIFVGMFVAYGVLTWVPPYLEESAGFSTSQVSFTSGLMTIIAIPSTFTAGWLAHRTGRPLVVAAFGLGLALLVAVFAVSSHPSPALASVVGALCVLGVSHALSPMNAVPAVLFGRSGGGKATGLAAAAGMSGAVASTLAGGWIVSATGSYTLVFGIYTGAAALASLAIIPFTALRLRRRHEVSSSPVST